MLQLIWECYKAGCIIMSTIILAAVLLGIEVEIKSLNWRKRDKNKK